MSKRKAGWNVGPSKDLPEYDVVVQHLSTEYGKARWIVYFAYANNPLFCRDELTQTFEGTPKQAKADAVAFAESQVSKIGPRWED